MGSQRKCHGVVCAVVEHKRDGEILTASDADLRFEEPGQGVEIVRGPESFIEGPSAAELNGKRGSLPTACSIRYLEPAHTPERDRTGDNPLKDVAGG